MMGFKTMGVTNRLLHSAQVIHLRERARERKRARERARARARERERARVIDREGDRERERESIDWVQDDGRYESPSLFCSGYPP